jgi:hypothetical protein
MGKWDDLYEFEAKIEFVSAKSRLVEDVFTGVRYWLPKSCTFDFNLCDADNTYYLFVVNKWWWDKRKDFIVEEREREQD